MLSSDNSMVFTDKAIAFDTQPDIHENVHVIILTVKRCIIYFQPWYYYFDTSMIANKYSPERQPCTQVP